jgi:peptidoglycan-N-acetylglucosamine deacetylase
MRLVLCALAVGLATAPLAAASPIGPEQPYRRPHVPYAWEQRRAVTLLINRGEPVFCGGGRSNAVALTFDDGPGPYTAQIIRILRAAGARATFFVVANRLQYWPSLARAETEVGAVGNHTWSHPRLTTLPRWLVLLELARAEWETKAYTGRAPRLFRAPYELHSPMTDGVVHQLGLLEVFWTVDSRDDAPRASAKLVVRNVLAGLRPGAIVLMHDLHPWTLQALPQILRAIRLRGLRAVSVPELLALDEPAPNERCPYARAVGPGD